MTPSSFTDVLSFKLSTFTPLLLVSKDVQFEVRQVLGILRPHFYRVIKESIYLDRIVSPCSMFLDICSRSRFILDSYPENSFDLLQNLPSANEFITNRTRLSRLIAIVCLVLGLYVASYPEGHPEWSTWSRWQHAVLVRIVPAKADCPRYG